MSQNTWICGICAVETTRCYCLLGPSPMKIIQMKWCVLKSTTTSTELKKITRRVLTQLVMKKQLQKEVRRLKQADSDYRILSQLRVN